MSQQMQDNGQKQVDEKFMQRALDLAVLGAGKVSPNPMVGCVIVHQEQIIGEGWHRFYGKAHAEVNAVNAVENKALLSEATVYVTLEPCAHQGKTPPCADLLTKHQVKRVVVCNRDPHPLVGGKGLEKLRMAGIEVTVGILEAQGKELNKRFFTGLLKQRPYVIFKWAETADGFIARKNYESKWISNKMSRMLVHKWRTEEDSIMVGSNTARYDNPKLNARLWKGRNPARVVIDRRLKLPSNLHLYNQQQLTLVYNQLSRSQASNLEFVKLDKDKFLEEVLLDLYEKNIRSVIVEGGSTLINLLIEQNMWDEARVFKSTQTVFHEGIKAPKVQGHLVNTERIMDDFYYEYRPITTS
ncbi:bifunctional diaminohydroxyphosphoribosylaminopyrimidine deaminase/5-amino-6-(5-phosphoribosylamino)uracil reductase RibD [uncultured Microscilla sp.]|uniref:bifunctional diaminohydroxyphosphoribosylaminopyrimidine deaminase/5-amino-6-(5-phosphoribosylamino)uracil reductase RibD n=1 Tax=uncultured Microscilla sp. TaxID=432653 RepID=UPI00262B779B|nr:bifunctional diaminohydroxyphosphoribosylaminopyrimidine deaminase/5-amino-6-(5-phosphoribosylamino)uracil reductase RibD [uncultured Microscilla sp.]